MSKYKISINKYFTGFAAFLVLLILTVPAPVSRAHKNTRESPVVKAVQKVSPAVVNISSEYKVKTREYPFSNFRSNPFFDSFFKDFFDHAPPRHHKRTSLGSGTIIDGKRGLILTNAHVIEKSSRITVLLKDEREFEARLIGIDPESDLAVLSISTEDSLPALKMGSSEDLFIGETVIAIGNPFGFSNTVTTGVISAVNRSIRTEDLTLSGLIQTDASINPGNSGGPLININGELIGINTYIYAKAQGIGFAIPIKKAKRIVSDLVDHGEVIQAWIGLTVQNLDSSMKQYYKLAQNNGVLVNGVFMSGPSHKAGIRGGDILLSIEKQKVTSVSDYKSIMRGIRAGETIKITLIKKKKKRIIRVSSTAFPEEFAMELAHMLLGIGAENISRGNRRKYGIDTEKGVVITSIEKNSFLANIGVRPGDVIKQIDDTNIYNLSDFKKAVIKYRQKTSLMILLQRADQLYYLNVRL